MSHRGVIYSVTQSIAYLEAALISAIALRKLEPNLPITILSDHPLLDQLPLAPYNITPQKHPAPPGASSTFTSRWIKTRFNEFTPYDETLFLDADILPLQPVSPLWDLLEDSDWAMATDRLPTIALCDHIAQPEKDYTLQIVPGQAMQYNGGVILWRRNAATDGLFDRWHREWLLFKNQDQLALARAIYSGDLPIATLPKTYNISPIDAAPHFAAGDPVHLLHCWGGMVGSGEFRRIAQSYYPDVVDAVDRLCRLPLGSIG
jgi:hypothetical protein